MESFDSFVAVASRKQESYVDVREHPHSRQVSPLLLQWATTKAPLPTAPASERFTEFMAYARGGRCL